MSSTPGLNITVALQGQDKVISGVKALTSEVERSSSSNVSSFGKTRAGVESISNELRKLEGYAKAYVGLSQLGGMAATVLKTADEYVGLQSRLKIATSSQLEFNTANTALYAIAQKNGVPLAESLSLYSKLSPALRELGASQAQTLIMTDLVGKSLRLSGAGASESAATMQQFSQALGSGVLRGDEFNSMMENSPRLMRAVADGLSKPIGELRKMAEQGQLTADVVVNALLSQKTKLEAEYSTLPLTISAAWTKLGNAVTQEIGRLDKAGGGLSGGLAKSLGSLADNLDQVERALKAGGVALAAFSSLKAIESTYAYVAALQAQRAASIAAAQAEVARVNMTYTASAASRAAAASVLAQATATGTLTGAIGGATAALRGFVAANPFLLIAAGIGVAAYAATKFFDDTVNGFTNFQAKIKTLSISQLSQERAALNAEVIGMKNSAFSGFYEKDIRMGEDRIRMMDAQIDKQQALANAPTNSLSSRANLSGYLDGGQSKTQQRSKDLADENKYYEQLISQSKGNKEALEQIEFAHKVRLEKISEKYKDKKNAHVADPAAGINNFISSQQKDVARQQFELDYLRQYGEAALSSKAAVMEFEIAQGKLSTTELKAAGITGAAAKAYQQLALEQARVADANIALISAEKSNAGLVSKSKEAADASVLEADWRLRELTILGQGREAQLRFNVEKKYAIALDKELAALKATPASDAQKAVIVADNTRAKEAEMGAVKVEIARDTAQKTAEEFKKSSERISQSLTDALMRGFENGKTFGQNLRDSLLNMFKSLVLEPQIKAAVQPVADMANKGIGMALSALFNANGNAFGGSGVQAFANGGTFTNSIVNSPTPFQFANGGGFSLGVMGEAGPEAVMPLTRTSGGQLGVRVAGGNPAQVGQSGSVTVNVVVNTQTGAVDSKAQGGENPNAMQQLGNQLGNIVRDMLVQEKRPGGILA